MPKKIQEETLPVAPLKIIALDGVKELGKKIDKHIVTFRKKKKKEKKEDSLECIGYEKDSYLIDFKCERFGSGEAKGVIKESIRGSDLYLITDVVNPDILYPINQHKTNMSPDDHFQDLKRIIAACGGHPHRINVIMPFLYEGRQNKRNKMESLDCALALQELVSMGVKNIITFDAHDPRVQNAIPIQGFDNFFTTLQMLKALLKVEPEIRLDYKNLMVVSPDKGGMSRAVYYSNILKLDMGMFYKRKDYSITIDGKNPMIGYEFLGNSVENKDILLVDDMIASGKSILETAKELKRRKAKKVFILVTFGLFANGLEKFDIAYQNNIFDWILTTNLTYSSDELKKKVYYKNVDLSKYISLIIDTINHDTSVNDIINPTAKIQKLLEKTERKVYEANTCNQRSNH